VDQGLVSCFANSNLDQAGDECCGCLDARHF
jgi:hypothetical protein